MSQYLIREIEAAPNIEVRYRTEVAGGGGHGRLEQLSLRHRDTGDTSTEPADGLFVLIGAQPFTDWLPEAVGRDQWGFILTGPDLAERWTLGREPYLLETSTPGVFARVPGSTGVDHRDPSSGPAQNERRTQPGCSASHHHHHVASIFLHAISSSL
jgi:alkyl hydroperoxide reductase subunit AhpF